MNDYNDAHSYARPAQARVAHIDLNLEVDFDRQVIEGLATLIIEAQSGADSIVLDTKALHIRRIYNSEGQDLPYELKPAREHFGSALTVSLPEGEPRIHIAYTTDPDAEALQWLSPVQTAGKEQPFLFTQSQAILARSWIPLQDSPGIRFTYTAEVQVPQGLLAVMSAENPQEKNASGKYFFEMKQPIPAYLMALAVGDFVFAPIGERTGVYAEPDILEAVKYEFAEMDEMLAIAESLYGAYKWERYDLIVLPPSFPFGGMENPRITFVTPTVVAGDRSLTSLVAHELAHSWSGNLVTNATWNDFWLNEGFTVYFEYRIMEKLHGTDYSEMLAALSMQDLRKEIDNFMEEERAADTRLKLDMSGRNPDDGVSSIAYDKGYFFLRYLEQYVGRERFDAFLNTYFQEHAFQANTTDQFMQYLKKNLFEKNNIEPPADLEEWVFGEGLPATVPNVQSHKFDAVNETLEAYKQGAPPENLHTGGWSTHEWLHFLRNLPQPLTPAQMEALDAAMHLTQSGNAEIQMAWYLQAVRHGYSAAYPAMEKFLINTGRRKFLEPLYKALIKTEKGREMARDIYEQARPNYHFVAVNTIDKLLDWQDQTNG